MREKILEIQNLVVSFYTYAGEVQAVRDVSLTLEKGEVLAIVGESGCGKSVTAQSAMKLVPSPPGKLKSGRIIFDGKDITNYSERKMESVRGSAMGMIFQDPMSALNPTMQVGRQIVESLRKHTKMSRKEAKERALEMLRMVGIPNPERRFKQYPHEFSGGMRHRAMIAIALACNPKLLIADEPTTALDVTIQAQILDLMQELRKKLDTGIILITHDLGVVAGIAENIAVMYAGKVVERGTADDIFYRPCHPYTWGLLKSVPRVDAENKEQLVPIVGTPPDLLAPPKGCAFAARCQYAMEICYERQPEETCVEGGHCTSCWLRHPDAPKVECPVVLEEA